MKKVIAKGFSTLSKPIARTAGLLAKASSTSTSYCFTYQPDVPEKLRSVRKAEK